MEQFIFEHTDAAEYINSTDQSVVPPLAARMRPESLDDYVGQRHLLDQGKLLRRAIDADRFTSIILSGPPGTGKTSLAEVIARTSRANFVRLSGVSSSVADIRRTIADAIALYRQTQRKTIAFVDEIHRFNKSQQDSLLPDVENGNIRLIGATTHNPQFYVVGALLSRSLVFQLEPLTSNEVRQLLSRACSSPKGFGDKPLAVSSEALDFLSSVCEGDGRRALNALELAVLTTPCSLDDGKIHIDRKTAEESIQRKLIVYGDDGHYDTISAFIKSMRGSDPDAAIYYLAKMLHAAEDLRFIARRLVIFASEDIGNADPRALTLAVSAMQAVDMIGLPESKLILSQAVTYCATAPKSNASYTAINSAMKDVETDRVQPIPFHLRDPHSAGAAANKHGQSYLYPHDFGGFVVQDYLGVEKSYYQPRNIGYESKIKERMDYFRQCRVTAAKDGKENG